MRNNLEVVLAAVTNDGLALQYTNKRLKNIKDVAMAAVKSDGRAIQFVCCKLHKDQEVLEAALYEARNSHRCDDVKDLIKSCTTCTESKSVFLRRAKRVNEGSTRGETGVAKQRQK